MKSFVSYLKDYFLGTSFKTLFFTALFVAMLIAVNYTFGIERRIREIHPWPLSLLSFFFFYGFVLFFAWGIQYSCGDRPSGGRVRDEAGLDRVRAFGVGRGMAPSGDDVVGRIGGGPVPEMIADYKRFFLFLLLAPLYFSFKMIHWDFSLFIPAGWAAPWSRYMQIVLQLPGKLLLLFLVLWVCRKAEGGGGTGELGGAVAEELGGSGGWYGLTIRNFRPGPYAMILLMMVPLVALASTQPDFLHTYPKVKNIAFLSGYAHPVWPWKALYELSYGLDFLSIELFFRGFLVIGLARYAGQYAILPMAAFYCTIHFGKPLGECISSLFGGLALGVIAWRTKSIAGGLMVHLGLAWMMELGGWVGGVWI